MKAQAIAGRCVAYLKIPMGVDIDDPQDVLFSENGPLGSFKGQINKDLAAADSFGRTPLHYAALYGHFHAIQLLVNIGADVRAEANGNTLIDMVANSATHEILSFLIARGSKPSDPSLYLKAYAYLPKVPNAGTNIQGPHNLALVYKAAGSFEDASGYYEQLVDVLKYGRDPKASDRDKLAQVHL